MLKTAAVLKDILAMPMQFNALVGDMGANLSGGQKQRIVLARALYREPSIMFMDEATSHLDLEKEGIVNKRINKFNFTKILVAHRPETISLQGGRLI